MKTVKDIRDFFLQGIHDGKALKLDDFLRTLPGYVSPAKEGLESIDMSIAQEYYQICEKMVADNLLVKVESNSMMCFLNKYIGVHEVNSSTPDAFIHELDYGVYDFKYRGFAYTWECLKDSVLYIVGINMKGDSDIGTAYYIGKNMVVTAAHCVDSFKSFTLHLSNHQEVPLKEVWYAKGQDRQDYDLAVLITVDSLPVKPLEKEEPYVLDDVLVMGYPPLSGFDAFQTVETASVGAILNGNQKATTGQIVSKTSPYMSKLDHFLINARVKGGNSGGPVVNIRGKVIGTVIELPFDSQSSSDQPRYDIMGYGVCLPSKYVDALINNHDSVNY